MRASTFACLLLAAFVATSSAKAVDQLQEAAQGTANPVRKVVNLLQGLQSKIQAEAEKEKEMYDKFMCYCKTGSGTLQTSIAAAEGKVPEVNAAIEEAIAKKAQLETDLKNHQASRADAKDAMAKATELREKEAKAFAAEEAEYKSNIAALDGAIKAITKGMSGGFLQTQTANTIRKLAISQDMNDADRQDLMAFLSGKQTSGYVPQSGQINGILQQLKDEMEKSLSDATDEENSAKAAYEDLMAAKQKEVQALTKAIEEKSKRVGDLAVEIVQMQDDLSDAQAALADDKKFLADLNTDCDAKTADFEERSKTRTDELLAIAETIKVLNDDDALELFKKTLPSASFIQVNVGAAVLKKKALAILAAAKKQHKPVGMELDFVELALKGKQVGFEKVIKMIDDMVAMLATEQGDDDAKKEYCGRQLDKADDSKKELERTIADEETAMADAEEGIATLKSEIEGLEDGIKALDKEVAELTEMRQAENADYKQLVADDSAAKELLAWAKNRLNKFYNPKLYKPPPKRELSEEERITVNLGGSIAPTEAPGGIAGTGISLAQVSLHRHQDAPPPPPEMYGAYSKKSEESTGIIQMIDLLVRDLDKEMQEAGVQEENAQKQYEQTMADSAATRAADSKELTSKQGMLAQTETTLQAASERKAGASTELAETVKMISSLHGECDWLLKYYDVRKEARASEVDALGRAKAVLSGADYSLLERTSNLRGIRSA